MDCKGVFLRGMLNSLTPSKPFPSFFALGGVVKGFVGGVFSELLLVVGFGGVCLLGTVEEEEEGEGEWGEGGTIPVGLELRLTRGVPVLSRPAGCREVGLFTALPRKLGSGLTAREGHREQNIFKGTSLRLSA